MTDHAQQIAQALQAASRARDAGDRAGTEGALAAALALAPADPRVHNALGMHALSVADYAAAVQHFAAAVAADPAAGPLLLNLATAHRGAGDAAGEAAALIRATALNQLDFVAHLRLAELHQRTDETRSAAIHWAAVVQMASGMPERPPLVADALMRGQAFLAQHNAGLAQVLDDRLGVRLAALGPDARRISACIDHSLGRRQIFTNHCDGVQFPFLPADEFFDARLFPWFADLEAQTGAIRAEALNLLDAGTDAIRPYVRMDAGTPTNKWSALDHNLDWSAAFLWEYGERNDALCALCPATAAALAALPQNHVPGKAPSAFFSILKPRAHIPAHTGVTNTRAIIHLPLVVPDGCRFRVGGETRAWVEGQAFAFDDTIDHEAWNDSDEVRIVLILDVWNPHLTADECALLAEFYAATDG